MADYEQTTKTNPRRPDCVTKIRMGNSVLVVSGYFKQDSTETAIDKMEKVLQAEAAATQKPTYPIGESGDTRGIRQFAFCHAGRFKEK